MRHRVIAYDRRGHGRSEIPPRESRFTVEVLAEVLRGLLGGLEIPESDFFGDSGGAITALALGLTFPARANPANLQHALLQFPWSFTRVAMLRAASTPEAEAWTRPRLTPAPSPTANRLATSVSRPGASRSWSE